MSDSSAKTTCDQGNVAPAPEYTDRRLGNYVLIRRLGSGGMADVYLAQQTSLNRAVAIKILKPELAKNKAYVDRFHREAQAAAGLTQANIIQIYEVGEFSGLHFISQEYVRGQNLRQFLNRHQVAEPVLAVSILRQVASALQKAGDHGVIHRDIKPENIMLMPNGEVKVADFGLARIAGDQRTDLTQIGITMGTPLYMSPEQAEGNRVDIRSDIYSLGVTAYHMLTGQPPFEADSPLAIAVKHLKEDPPDLNALRPDLPKELCDLVYKMLAKDPSDRYQDPSQLLRDLRGIELDESTDWDRLTEKLAVNDTVIASQSRQTTLEITRQLESLMRGSFRPWWTSPALWVSILAALILGPVAGALYAISNPPPDPLAVSKDLDARVPKMETADQQFHLARMKNREDYWLAVREYFPPGDRADVNGVNLRNAWRADEHLGYFYLERGSFDQAKPCFAYLATLPDIETRLRNVGFAGLALVHDGLDEEAEARDALLEVNVDDLNRRMEEKIVELLARYLPY